MIGRSRVFAVNPILPPQLQRPPYIMSPSARSFLRQLFRVCSEIAVSRAILLRLVVSPPILWRQKYRIAWFSVRSTGKACPSRSDAVRGDSFGDSRGG